MNKDKTLGQIAFEAYGDNREWKDWRGQPMPQWNEVKEGIREAWEVAAEAVKVNVEQLYLGFSGTLKATTNASTT